MLLNIDNVKKDSVKEDNLLGAKNDFDAIRIWLMHYTNPLTNHDHKSIVERFYSWLVVNQRKNLSQLSVEDVISYKQWLKQPDQNWCGPSKHRNSDNWKPFVKGLSNNSIVHHLSVLSGMMTFFNEAGYLRANAFKISKKLKYQYDLRDKYLTSKEYLLIKDLISKKFSAHKKRQLIWVFDLLFYTGCRRSEVINAKQSDIFVRNGMWWLRVVGKGDKLGEVPIPEALFEQWIKYRSYWKLPPLPVKLEHNIPLIIKNAKYQAMTPSNLYKLIKSAANQLVDYVPVETRKKCLKLSCHWLRHSSATAQVDAGIDIRVVQANLRHTLITTTMRYLHIDDDKRHLETSSKFHIGNI